jgi:hypothetical protein
MSKTVMELADTAINTELAKAYGPAKDESELKEHAKKFAYTERLLGELLRSNDKAKAAPPINLSEAVHMADFKILFPKVVMSVLQKPKEPVFIGQGGPSNLLIPRSHRSRILPSARTSPKFA